MRLFIPMFLVLAVVALALVYSPALRTAAKTHAPKILLTVTAAAALLFAIFAAMSVSTWRLF